jgi:hypothetical protein
MADAGKSWSSRLVRDKTATRLARIAANKAMAKEALALNSAVMDTKVAHRPSAVFSDSSGCVARRGRGARAAARASIAR